MKKAKPKTMIEITKGYEAFVKGKEIIVNKPKLFEKVIKKAVAPKKQRGSE